VIIIKAQANIANPLDRQSKWESHKRMNPVMIARRIGSGSAEEIVTAGKRRRRQGWWLGIKVTGVAHVLKSQNTFQEL
jgi:hypothetical protein